MANELRWILLGLGALFLAGLALWELRRPRHAARKRSRQQPTLDSATWYDSPTISVADEHRSPGLPGHRDAGLRRDPPIVMLDDMPQPGSEQSLQVASEVAVDRPAALPLDEVDALPEPAHQGTKADVEPEAISDAAPEPLPEPPAAPIAVPPATAPSTSKPAPLGVHALSLEPPPQVPIQWPPVLQERILMFRVVPQEGLRFPGRALRHALHGCGLVLGPQDIFHWADEAGRVIASAANLVRPGSFDLDAMDSQEFPGLHLFSVLPGPLPTLQTYDELLSLARDLATRLDGIVQDDTGRELEDEGIASRRKSLSGVPPDDGAQA